MTTGPSLSFFAAVGATFMGLSVALGAFAAHSLKGTLTPQMLGVLEKGVTYQSLHAIGIIFAAVAYQTNLLDRQAAKVVCLLFIAGIVLFSGSLYLLSVTDRRWMGMITPFGGVLFILGWFYFAVQLVRHQG